MKNIQLIMAAMALAGLCACNKTEEGPSSTVNVPRPVGFGTYVNLTRAKDLQTDNLRDFGVFAFHTQNESWSPSALPDFMYNQKVSGSVAEGFSYTPVKYWPSSDGAKLSFFAYAPYGTVANGLSPQSSNTDAGAPKIKYAVPSGEADQPDLLVAGPVYDATLQQSGGTVHFQFRHSLSRIGFQARLADGGYEGSTLYLNAISLTSTFPTSGVIDLGDGTWSDVTSGRERTVSRNFGQAANGLVLGTARQDANGLAGYIMCIPGGEARSYTLSVTYTIVTVDPALSGGALVCTNTFSKDLTLQTEAGKTYDLCIQIGPTAIEFSDPEVSVWAVGETVDIAHS